MQAEKCGEWNGLENVPGGSSYSDKIELVGGQNYWIEAVHVHRDSVASNNSNFLQVRRHPLSISMLANIVHPNFLFSVQISLRQYNTELVKDDLDLAINEAQGLYLRESRVLERQKVTVQGVAGDLTLTHNGVPAQTPVSAADFSGWADNLDTMLQWQCTRYRLTKLHDTFPINFQRVDQTLA